MDFIDDCNHKELYRPIFFRHEDSTIVILINKDSYYSKEHGGYIDEYILKTNNNCNQLLLQLVYILGKSVFNLYNKFECLDSVFEQLFGYQTIIKYIKNEKLKEKLLNKHMEEII